MSCPDCTRGTVPPFCFSSTVHTAVRLSSSSCTVVNAKMATTSAFMVNPPQIESPGDKTTPASASQQPGHASFRRQRASRACEVRYVQLLPTTSAPRSCRTKNTNHGFSHPQTCHARKVRCDAASLGGMFTILCIATAPGPPRPSARHSI